MSTNHTANYNLSQWSPSDSFLRAEFNENLQKIDTALAAKINVLAGEYTGTGSYPRTIDVGVKPKAVWLQRSIGSTYVNGAGTFGGFMAPGFPLQDGSRIYAEVTGTGFQVKNDYLNKLDTKFRYFVFY